MRQGTCYKCGTIGNVVAHHWHGYEGIHKNDVVDYCYSCDQKAHIKAKNDGICNLPREESNRLSHNSNNARDTHSFTFSETLIPNIRLLETIRFRKTTNNICVSSDFYVSHGKYIPMETL